VTVRVDSPARTGLVVTVVLPPALLVDVQATDAVGVPGELGRTEDAAGWMPRSPYVPALTEPVDRRADGRPAARGTTSPRGMLPGLAQGGLA
jgi:hypothetical protein